MICPLCQHQSYHDTSRAMLTGSVILFTWWFIPLQSWLPSGQWSKVFAFCIIRPRSILMCLPQFPCLNILIFYQAPAQRAIPLSTTFESKYIFLEATFLSTKQMPGWNDKSPSHWEDFSSLLTFSVTLGEGGHSAITVHSRFIIAYQGNSFLNPAQIGRPSLFTF